MTSRGDVQRDRLVVFAGDIHGEWRRLAALLDKIRAIHGNIDAVFAVGDVEAVRTPAEIEQFPRRAQPRHRLDFQQLLAGQFALPAPVYFIGGNHEAWASLDEEGPGGWGPNVFYLGRSGVQEIAGLRVAFLSGVFSSKTSPARQRGPGNRVRAFWNAVDYETLTAVSAPVDVLVTHDWPSGLSFINSRTGRAADYGDEGNAAVRRLAEGLEPRVLACGHRHRGFRDSIGATEVLCLGRVNAERGGVVAMRVDSENAFHELSTPSLTVREAIGLDFAALQSGINT